MIDFMTPANGSADLVRIVTGISGEVTFDTELCDLLRLRPDDSLGESPRIWNLDAIGGPEWLVLRTPMMLRGENHKTVGELSVSSGQSMSFVLSYGNSFEAPPSAIDAFKASNKSDENKQRLDKLTKICDRNIRRNAGGFQ